MWLGAAIGLLPWLAAAAFACVHLALPLLGSLTVVMHVERHSGPCNGENMRPHPSHDVNPRSQPRHAETLWAESESDLFTGIRINQIYSLEQYTVIPTATYSFVPPGCCRGGYFVGVATGRWAAVLPSYSGAPAGIALGC